MKYYTTRLKLGNVAHIEDVQDDHFPTIAQELHNKGHISKEDHQSVIDANKIDAGNGNTAKETLLGVLKKNNIDTISYNNEYEGDGTSKSYMITHPSQVRVLKKGNLDISKNRK